MGLSFSHGLRVAEDTGAYHTQRQTIWAGFWAGFSARGATRSPPVDLAKLESGAGWQGFGLVVGSRLPLSVGSICPTVGAIGWVCLLGWLVIGSLLIGAGSQH